MKRSCVMSGDLEAMGLADIVQNLTLGARTAHVSVEASSRRGELWLRDGALKHAETGVLSGETAVFEMLGWKEGRFVIEYDVVSDARSIEQESTYLVLEGLRRLDERNVEHPSPNAREPSSNSRPATGLAIRSRDRARWLGTALIGVAVVGVVVLATSGLLPWTVPDSAAMGDDLTGRNLKEIPPDVVTSARSASRRAAVEVAQPDVAVPAADDRDDPLEDDASSTVEEPAVTGEDEAEVERGSPGVMIAPLVPLILSSGLGVQDEQAVVQATAPPVPQGSLRIEGKCKIDDGAIEVFVGDDLIWSRDSGSDDKFDARVRVPAGRNDIVTRVDLGREGAVYESRLEAHIREGGEHTLKIVAGKRFGSPVSVKLD